MKTMTLGSSDLAVPAVAVGCMRMKNLSVPDAARLIQACLEAGANFFDHADIYGAGRCEELFAEAAGRLGAAREAMILQSKCGIRKGMYDFSKEHILQSAEGILKRLKTDYLDVLLLHRPDLLMEPEEVAEAFDRLYAAGKIRYFGVSNQNPAQISLLRKTVRQPLLVNQLQFGIGHTTLLQSGANVNMKNDAAVNRDGSVLDFCRLHNITIQAWSPFQHGFFEGVFLDREKFPALNETIDGIAAKHGVSNTTIALAWILRHPAKIQPVTGSMNTGRLRDCFAACSIALSREDWYAIYRAAGNPLP